MTSLLTEVEREALERVTAFAAWQGHNNEDELFRVDLRELCAALRRLEASARGEVAGNDARQVCAEAYQVVGSLLSDLGKFDTIEAERILDNLAEAKPIHSDVLPWPSFAHPQAPAAVSALSALLAKLERVASKHNDRSCDFDVCKEVRDAYAIIQGTAK